MVWVRLPDLPMMVTVTVPGVALRAVKKVNVLVLVAGLMLNEAVVPLRMPDADSETLPLKPFDCAIEIVVVPLLPRATLRLVGDADRLKFGAAVTMREIVVEWLRPLLSPVIVTLKVPAAALAPAFKVNVLILVVLTGLNDAVTPLGRPEALKVTLPLKPFCGTTVTVVPPLAP